MDRSCATPSTTRQPAWHAATPLPWSRAILLALLGLGFFYLLSARWLGLDLENQIARPIEFRFRHLLRRDPPLDPRLQVFTYGDATVNTVDRVDLTLSEWADLLVKIAERKPRAILVSKIWGNPPDLENADRFVRRLKSLPSPVITGAFYLPRRIPGNKALFPLEGEDYRLQAHLGGGDLDHVDWYPVHPGYAYAAHPSIREVFRPGHAQYLGDDLIAAFIRPDREHALPALPLLAAKDFTLDRQGLIVDKHRVPLDSAGRFLVDFSPPVRYYEQSRSLSGLLVRLRHGKPLETIAEGAVVVILPAMYTGHTDLVASPFGLVPGGFTNVAVVNSVLRGSWLGFLPGGRWVVLLSAALGLWLAMALRGAVFGLALGAVMGIEIAGGLLLFSFLSVEAPWMSAALSLGATAIPVFVEKTRRAETRARRLHDALSGTLSDERLRKILDGTAPLVLEPIERTITSMFIDIVGFSYAAQRVSPRSAFLELKELLGEMTAIVHAHGGVVDKSIGDGMLCFFGYHYDGSELMKDHADQAIRCALEVQNRNVRKLLEAHAAQRLLLPLRIGINTASVYIGDLGGKGKIDLTLIGDGVNMAKRLESACDSGRIMLGADTREALCRPEEIGVPIAKRFISVKHFPDLVEAYECDPLASQPELREQADAAYLTFLGLQRRDQRRIIPPGSVIVIKSELGNGELRNFSESGLGVRLDRYLGRGVSFTLELDSPDGKLSAHLASLGLSRLLCEVRWGHYEQDGFSRLGLEIKNLTSDQKGILLSEIHASTHRKAA